MLNSVEIIVYTHREHVYNIIYQKMQSHTHSVRLVLSRCLAIESVSTNCGGILFGQLLCLMLVVLHIIIYLQCPIHYSSIYIPGRLL